MLIKMLIPAKQVLNSCIFQAENNAIGFVIDLKAYNFKKWLMKRNFKIMND